MLLQASIVTLKVQILNIVDFFSHKIHQCYFDVLTSRKFI